MGALAPFGEWQFRGNPLRRGGGATVFLRDATTRRPLRGIYDTAFGRGGGPTCPFPAIGFRGHPIGWIQIFLGLWAGAGAGPRFGFSRLNRFQHHFTLPGGTVFRRRGALGDSNLGPSFCCLMAPPSSGLPSGKGAKGTVGMKI